MSWCANKVFNFVLLYTMNNSRVFSNNVFASKIINADKIQSDRIVVKNLFDVGKLVDWVNSVIAKSLSTPPGTPSDGDRYLIKGAGTGAWEDKDNHIAEWNSDENKWDFVAPQIGMTTFVGETEMLYVFEGSDWKSLNGITLHNNLGELDGGTDEQYFHLTSNQHSSLTGINQIEDLSTDGNPSFETLDGGNLRLTGNTLRSIDTNGNINLAPDGNGRVNTDSLVRINDNQLIVRQDGEDKFVVNNNGQTILKDDNYPVCQVVRINNFVGSVGTTIQSISETTNDIVDGFGTGIEFRIRNNTVNERIGFISCERSNQNNTGLLRLQTYSSGNLVDRISSGVGFTKIHDDLDMNSKNIHSVTQLNVGSLQMAGGTLSAPGNINIYPGSSGRVDINGREIRNSGGSLTGINALALDDGNIFGLQKTLIEQQTNKATAVTVNSQCGIIRTVNDLIPGESTVFFVVNNTFVDFASVIILTGSSESDDVEDTDSISGIHLSVRDVVNNQFKIVMRNMNNVLRGGKLDINFMIM